MRCPTCHSENKENSRFCNNCGVPLGQTGPEAASLTKTLETPVQVLKPGTLIGGKYKIIDEIGHGGMGVVYSAEDIRLKRTVAIKFLPPHLADFADLKERFLIEAQAAAALSHPNICVIHEIGEAEGRPFITMEHVVGETLRDKIKKGPFKPEEAVDIVSQVAAGLAEAHGKGIIHRDIKSGNIMVTPKGRAKVMDFGLAKLRGSSSLTKSQTTLGTVAYMSPEQARGGKLDGRTDIWSLGVVLYEMLSGKLPFKGEHDQSVIYAILHEEPESLAKARPGLAPDLEHIVGQALSKKPADRYQTMEEFLEDLSAMIEGLKPLKAKPKPAAVKLAVLPFANLTGDPEQEYLSDGLTQEMIARLGRLHPQSLSVIARTSVMRYKKTEMPIDQIGRELGVDYVLEGSTQREGGRVRIIAELIQVRDQVQLWADIVEREMSGILALQNDVAEKVAKALALKLLPAEQARLASARPVNPKAYEAYLKGLQHSYKLLPAELDTAFQYFELALKKDPNHALAYAGISFIWACRQQMGLTPAKEAGPKAKEAALKSLALDDTLAEAHYALANIMAWGEWDWPGAEKEFKRTIEINPNFPDARIYYSHLLNIMGRPDEAMAQLKQALELDPYNSLFQSLAAADFLMVRRYDEAIAQARSAQRTNADDPVAHSVAARSLFMKGAYKETFEEWKAFWSSSSYGNREMVKALDQGYAEADFTGAMKRAADTDASLFISGNHHDNPSCIAMFYIMAGEKDHALEWFEKAFELQDPNMVYLCFPEYDSVRSDPRFQSILHRMNYPTAGEK
jgi:serine/threonine protein kinase/tetratricopeptide (TPR) repeat protein